MSVLEYKLKYQLRTAEYPPARRQVSPWLLLLAGMLVFGLLGALKTGEHRRQLNLADQATPSVDVPATDSVPAKGLNARMAAARDSVAQRYRVAPEALQPIFLAAQQASKDLDPLLIIAVIGIESGFNPFAQSVMGAQGLMQVIPRYHRDKLPPDAAASGFLDPVSNVRVGAQVLQESIRRQGGVVEGLQHYAGASDDPDRGYSSRVIAEKQRLEQAVRGRKNPVPAVAPTSRPAVPIQQDAAPKTE